MLKSLKTTRKRLAEKLSGNVSSSSCSSASSNDEPVSRCGPLSTMLCCVLAFENSVKTSPMLGWLRRCLMAYPFGISFADVSYVSGNCELHVKEGRAIQKPCSWPCRQPSVGHEYVHQSRGHVKAHGDAAPRVSWSSAGYQAKTPFGDINILQVGPNPVALVGKDTPLAYAVHNVANQCCSSIVRSDLVPSCNNITNLIMTLHLSSISAGRKCDVLVSR